MALKIEIDPHPNHADTGTAAAPQGRRETGSALSQRKKEYELAGRRFPWIETPLERQSADRLP
jgi:hypothetical protein